MDEENCIISYSSAGAFEKYEQKFNRTLASSYFKDIYKKVTFLSYFP